MLEPEGNPGSDHRFATAEVCVEGVETASDNQQG